MKESEWYFYCDRTQDGPFPESALARRFSQRLVPLHALVWSADHWPDEQWRPAREMPFFRSAAMAPPEAPPAAVPEPRSQKILSHSLTPQPIPIGVRGTATPPPLPSASQRAAVMRAASNRKSVQPLYVASTPPSCWERYWARTLDTYSMGTMLAIMTVDLFLPNEQDNPFVDWMLAPFLWLFAEALLLSLFGNTPGRWLFGFRVETIGGGPLDFHAALRRSFAVYIRGLGAGVPFVSMLTMLEARQRVKTDGIATWDRNGDLHVIRQRNSWPGWTLLAFLAFVLFLVCMSSPTPL